MKEYLVRNVALLLYKHEEMIKSNNSVEVASLTTSYAKLMNSVLSYLGSATEHKQGGDMYEPC